MKAVAAAIAAAARGRFAAHIRALPSYKLITSERARQSVCRDTLSTHGRHFCPASSVRAHARHASKLAVGHEFSLPNRNGARRSNDAYCLPCVLPLASIAQSLACECRSRGGNGVACGGLWRTTNNRANACPPSQMSGIGRFKTLKELQMVARVAREVLDGGDVPTSIPEQCPLVRRIPCSKFARN